MPITELENNSEAIWVKVFAHKKILLITWQVIVSLVAPVKTSNCLEISSLTLGPIIRGKMFSSFHVLGDFNF